MQEFIISFSDVQKTLVPIFGSSMVRIVIEGNEVNIVPHKIQRKKFVRHDVITAEDKALQKFKEEEIIKRYLRSYKPEISKKEVRIRARAVADEYAKKHNT
jgi:hypothetical protein